jgi:antitoxin VapB
MPLFLKNAEVEALADRLARLRGVTKTEAVRRALVRDLAREDARPDIVEAGLAFARILRARTSPELGRPADKAFIDSLYEP